MPRVLRRAALGLAIAAALAFPFVMGAEGDAYYVSFASRILVYALAATSLNLILGYGGMISFGHAAFVGTGAYVSSILLAEGIASAWIGWPAAIAASALAALAIGAVSLRTRGAYFIMITLAFAQMMYFLVNSMKAYGGDEGLTLPARARVGLGIDLDDAQTFYYVALAALAAALVGLHRLSHSRFGRVIQAIRENEVRAEAIGFPVYRYKLVCFVIAGAAAGLAGALLASHGKYVNPSVLHWTQSGTLMVMAILGGVGCLWGGALGALALLGLEDLIANHRIAWVAALLPNYQQHASLGVGLTLLAVVLFAPQGIAGLLARRGSRVHDRGSR
ncbi:MAG TPA: branched-chain amino acid ABC transporter permease [Burkholderiales bacterium]|nr:branched-chain amino acid ABC transporter permease [Burkholderiales bacterium]